MVQTFEGDVNFTVHGKPCPHRFEVSATEEDKVVLWIEDRHSKKQWHTNPLETKDYVTNSNVIPMAKGADYAEWFSTCLGSTDEASGHKRILSTKGEERVLVLMLPLQWASRDLALEYKFTMKEVPLERIDILGARMRDVEEKVSAVAEERLHQLEQENETLKAEAKRLSERVEELSLQSPMFAQATTTSHHSVNQTLVWTERESDANGTIEFHSQGSVRFHVAGVYAIDIGVTHAGTSNTTIFELTKAGTVLASCQGSSNHGFSTTPLHYVLKANAEDEISVVYKASGSAYAGSFIAIVKL